MANGYQKSGSGTTKAEKITANVARESSTQKKCWEKQNIPPCTGPRNQTRGTIVMQR